MVGAEGFEPTIDAISRTNYVSTAYKTASLRSYIGSPYRICTDTLRVRAGCTAIILKGNKVVDLKGVEPSKKLLAKQPPLPRSSHRPIN